jgi:hypothetical protein
MAAGSLITMVTSATVSGRRRLLRVRPCSAPRRYPPRSPPAPGCWSPPGRCLASPARPWRLPPWPLPGLWSGSRRRRPGLVLVPTPCGSPTSGARGIVCWGAAATNGQGAAATPPPARHQRRLRILCRPGQPRRQRPAAAAPDRGQARWWRSGTASSAPTNGPQTRQTTTTPAGRSPAPGPPRPWFVTAAVSTRSGTCSASWMRFGGLGQQDIPELLRWRMWRRPRVWHGGAVPGSVRAAVAARASRRRPRRGRPRGADRRQVPCGPGR